MSCTTAINPPFPPTKARSHTLRTLLIARNLSCRLFREQPPPLCPYFVPFSWFLVAEPCRGWFLGISDPEKSFMQTTSITLILIYHAGLVRQVTSYFLVRNITCFTCCTTFGQESSGEASFCNTFIAPPCHYNLSPLLYKIFIADFIPAVPWLLVDSIEGVDCTPGKSSIRLYNVPYSEDWLWKLWIFFLLNYQRIYRERSIESRVKINSFLVRESRFELSKKIVTGKRK